MTSARLTPEEIEALQQDKAEKLAAASREFDRIAAEREAARLTSNERATDAST